MGTKKLKSESRKHSSADRPTERETDRQQVSGFSQQETLPRGGVGMFTVHTGGEKKGRAARTEIRTYRKFEIREKGYQIFQTLRESLKWMLLIGVMQYTSKGNSQRNSQDFGKCAKCLKSVQ